MKQVSTGGEVTSGVYTIYYIGLNMPFQDFCNNILSMERLSSFQENHEELLEETLKNYLWNIELCESLYPALNFLEVALRNRIHVALSSHFGEYWLLETGASPCLRTREQEDVQKVRDRIHKSGKKITPGRVVAGLNLGFWLFLLSKQYDVVFWHKNLPTVFPNLSKDALERNSIHKNLERVWRLRNRTFHYEPICSSTTLLSDYGLIRYLLNGLSSECLIHLDRIDRFQQVYARQHRPPQPPTA
jgi:hypothetical protein